MIRALIAAASALVLTACAVGPNFESPAPSAPALKPFVGAAAPQFSNEPAPAGWWRLYRDPVLDALVTQALSANTDLRVAAANLAQARAALNETRSASLPSTTLSAGAERGRVAATTLGGTTALPDADTYSGALDISYQVDLFGKVRRATEGARANVEAVQAARDVVAVTVAAETVRAYTDACAAGAQLAVANTSLDLQLKSLDLTTQLLTLGRESGLDAARAGALAEQTRATIPTLQAARRTSLYRLAVLTGRPPADFEPEAAACVALPKLATPIPVGDGARLMGRRPDVRQAERRLAEATAQIGVATADLYPSISLGASVGSIAPSTGKLGSDSAFHYSIGPLISWSFPNIVVARSRIAQARAGAEGALATFDGTWLTALKETESALTQYANELDRNAALARARDRSAQAANLAGLRYRAGADSYLTLLDAQRTLSDTEADLARSNAQLTTYQISVFLALGGGWESLPRTASAAGATGG